MAHKEIYVETTIAAPIVDVWEKTQNPVLHEQWDIRFSSITYLPKEADEAQRFTYTRTLMPGVKISGWGESVGNHEKVNGTKSSSLHFGTPQIISPIKEGRGYWQYIPSKEREEVTFLTAYNYEPNYGKLGKLLDKLVFRPLMGWGTALSFDILKRWLEKDEAPDAQYRRFKIVYGLTIFFAFVWFFQGLVPKIIAMHPEEMMMTGELFPVALPMLKKIIIGIGIVEILFGFVWLLYPYKRHLFALQFILFPLLMLLAVTSDAQIATHPFSPVTFNIALTVLSIIGFSLSKDVPTAKNCRRKRTHHGE